MAQRSIRVLECSKTSLQLFDVFFSLHLFHEEGGARDMAGMVLPSVVTLMLVLMRWDCNSLTLVVHWPRCSHSPRVACCIPSRVCPAGVQVVIS
jgi:hypothetical protein